MNQEHQPLLRQDERGWPYFNRDYVPPTARSKAQRSRQQLRSVLTSRFGHYAVLLLVILDTSCIFASFMINLFTCEKQDPEPGWTTALGVLSIVTLVFSCLFMVELLASMWAFGAEYFKSKFHCFDATVIVAGFIIDVLTTGVIEEVASLVVVFRLWRVFKIIEELSLGAQEQREDLMNILEELKRENKELKTEIAQLKAQNHPDQGGRHV